ncbi:Tetratricopeptide repeat-containing protein [Paenibacillus sp. 1_12]|nr:Tetratricopeptide repeat-containing protein [Paenibacillus sp. 1_12]
MEKLKLGNSAIESYKKCVEINSDNDDAHYNLGNLLYYQKLYKEALEHLDKAIEINPNDFNYYYNKGVVLTKTGNIQEAEASFRIYRKLLS